MDNLTCTELSKLKEFRKLVSDVLKPDHDDAFLLRWLRARNFKLADAEAMLRKSMAWRARLKVDNILETFKMSEVFKNYWPLGLLGHDKEGNPLWLFRYGMIDMKGLVYSAKKSDINLLYIYLFEISAADMKKQSKKLGRRIEKHSYIFDMENFSLPQILWKPAFDILSTTIMSYEDNYPECLKNAYIINASPIFHIAFALLKPFYSESTYNKIQISGKDGWKNTLLQYIDAEILPVSLGGTRIGPNGDPNCTNLVPAGGIVPESYYLQESQSLSNDEDVEILEVGVKSINNVEVFIPEGDSILQWEFKTDKHDIGFGVFYKQDEYNDNDLIEVVPLDRVNCHLVPETGSLICENEGTYLLKFDNSFSYFRSKTVKFRTEVIPPTTKL